MRVSFALPGFATWCAAWAHAGIETLNPITLRFSFLARTHCSGEPQHECFEPGVSDGAAGSHVEPIGAAHAKAERDEDITPHVMPRGARMQASERWSELCCAYRFPLEHTAAVNRNTDVLSPVPATLRPVRTSMPAALHPCRTHSPFPHAEITGRQCAMWKPAFPQR